MYGGKGYWAKGERGREQERDRERGPAEPPRRGYTEAQQTQYAGYLGKLKKEFDERFGKKGDHPISYADTEVVRTLGAGAFGRVVLLRHKRSGRFLAMKILEKEKIVKMKQIEHTLYEKRILEAIRFPFVVTMQFSFKDNAHVYFGMEFVAGGEMFSHLRRLGKFDEPLARFYAAQTVLALEYLHACGLVYRDLKPENILVERTGYLKVTDFGFCKLLRGRAWTLCGTPEYLAPELILNRGYGFSVDWWSFGVLLFEMNAGFPPFCANDPMRTYEKIVAGRYRAPAHFTAELKDLVRSTLQTDVTRRFGVLKNGTLDFKQHRWFEELDWEAVLNCRVNPPYLPKVKSPGDTSNFDPFDDRGATEDASTCRFESQFVDF